MALTMIFMKLYVNGKVVKGEAQTASYEDQIEVESFSWKLGTKLLPGETNERARTEVRPKHISVSKVYDEASGNLCVAARKRSPVSSARFTMVSMALNMATGRNQKVMELLLTDGFVEDLSLNLSDGDKSVGIKERLTLSYRKSQVMYYPLVPKSDARGAAMTFDIIQSSIGS